MCENLIENEARLVILGPIQILRVLTRKPAFSVIMRSQKGHKYWTQLPTTMKFCKNVPHIYISWKPRSFKCENILVSPDWEIFGQKSGKSGKIWSFSLWGVQIWKFLKFGYFNAYFYYQNECCVKIWVKTKQIFGFYGVFCF